MIYKLMDYLYDYLIIIVLTRINFLQAGMLDRIAENIPVKQNFTEADFNCKLIGKSSSSSVEDIRIVTVPSLLGGLYWVKAEVRKTPWIAFDGCRLIKRSRFGKNMTSPANSVVECWKFCTGYENFALKGQHCICLKSVPVSSDEITVCSYDSCPGKVDNICGDGRSANKQIPKVFLYRIVQNQLFDSWNTTSYNCIAVTRKNPENDIFSHPCEEELGRICRYTDNRYIQRREKTSWVKALRNCSNSGGTIAGKYTFDVNAHGFYFPVGLTGWIGIFRENYFVLTNESSTSQSDECVAAMVTKEGKLKLQKANCRDNLPSLCEPGTYQYIMNNNENPDTFKGVRLILPVMFGILVVSVLTTTTIMCIYRKRKRQRLLSTSAMRKLLREDSSVWGTRINDTRDLSNTNMNKYEYSEVELQRVSVAAGSSYNEIIFHKVEELDCEVFEKYDHITVHKDKEGEDLETSQYDGITFHKEKEGLAKSQSDDTYDHAESMNK